MNPEIKEIFINTLNPDINIRTKSEVRLAQLQKDYKFLTSLPTTLMKDSNIIVKKTSSIYFKSSVISEWSNQEFESSKNFIISNLIDFYISADEINNVSYNKILVHFFDYESPQVVQEFLSKVSDMIKSNELLRFSIALNIIGHIFYGKKIIYNLEDILNLIYEKSGEELVSTLYPFVSKNDFKTAKEIMKFISKSYNYYSVPNFLQRLDVFSYVINFSTEILKMQNNSDKYFMKMKKWVSHFLYKACNKGIKKFYKNEKLSKFITEPQRFTYIYEVFLAQLMVDNLGYKSEPIELNTVCFLTLCASDKDTYKYMSKDLIFIITEYILAVHEFDDNEENCFENDPERYIRQKYHYLECDLRNECGSLFSEIIKSLKHNGAAMDWLFQFFIHILEDAKNNPTEKNHKRSYGVYFLMSHVSHTLFKASKALFENILFNYVFYDLKYGIPILKSQACYFLSSVEEKVTLNQNVLDAISNVMTIVRGRHPILSVDSTLAMNFFISNKELANYVINYIGELVESILTLSKSYDIEPLTYLLDNIMQSFTDEVTFFAPKLVSSMGNLIKSHLADEQTESENRIMVISGFFRNVETVISTENLPAQLTFDLFKNFYDVLELVLLENQENYYQEVLDIINCFFYSITTFDDSMEKLLCLILNLDTKDIILPYSQEISEIIDNAICNGKEKLLNQFFIDKFFTIFVNLCVADEEGYIYDESFITGCKIIESLLLNIGEQFFTVFPDKLAAILELVTENLTKLDESTSAIIFGIELIMNCFVIRPFDTYNILKLRNFDEMFFFLMCDKRKQFKRVHDKKIVIRFLGKLFSIPQSDIQIRCDIKQISNCFFTVFCSLPDAIDARNKLMAKSDKEEDNELDEEYTDGEYSEEYNDLKDDFYLEEDIYFSSVLDYWDPYAYIDNIFKSSSFNTSICALVISNMSSEKKSAIKNVFENRSRVQQRVKE